MMLSVFCLSLVFVGYVRSEMEEDSYNFEGRADLDWDYDDPEKWKDKYPACGGKNQSPINLTYSKLRRTRPLRFIGYNRPRLVSLKNKGYTVQLELMDKVAAPCIEGGELGGRYCFSQLHFHWGLNNSAGADHPLNGRRGAAAMHMVHTKQSGNGTSNLAIIGVMYRASLFGSFGLRNIVPTLSNVTYKGDSTVVKQRVRLSELLPFSYLSFFRYKGSIPAPPCTENVLWTVFRRHTPISNRQLNEFRKLMRTEKGSDNPKPIAPNYRPPQNLNDRDLTLLFQGEF